MNNHFTACPETTYFRLIQTDMLSCSMSLHIPLKRWQYPWLLTSITDEDVLTSPGSAWNHLWEAKSVRNVSFIIKLGGEDLLSSCLISKSMALNHPILHPKNPKAEQWPSCCFHPLQTGSQLHWELPVALFLLKGIKWMCLYKDTMRICFQWLRDREVTAQKPSVLENVPNWHGLVVSPRLC